MPSDRGTTAQRDAGLRRVSRLTRWLLAGALALTAGFSAIAARSFSGTSGKQSSSQSASQSGSTTSGDDGSTQSDDSGSGDSSSNEYSWTFQSPFSSPSASSGSGSVTSGGS